MMHFKIVNRTKAQLRRMVTPKAVEGGNLQAIPYVLFDTQTYLSGATTALTFFQTTPANPTLGNMNTGGSLPVDTWLEIEWMCVSALVPATSTATGLNGAWGDMSQLMWEAAPTHRLKIQDKDYGTLPVSFFGSEGGISGFGYNEAAAGAVAAEYANFGNGCGFWCGGQITIPPQAGFNAQLAWNAPVTLPSGTDIPIRVSYLGTLHRPIL